MLNVFLNVKIKGNYPHIRDLNDDLFSDFWDLMEAVNYNYEITYNEYFDIIDDLVDLGHATVGDYKIILLNYKDEKVIEKLKKEKNQTLVDTGLQHI